MSNKTTAEIEHKLTVDNDAAVKKVEAQAAAYKKLADAQKQAEARERTGTTGMDADTVRLLRMARADKAAGRYTDMASQGFSNEDMMRRYRAERNLVMPDAQKREMERTQALLAGGGAAGGKSGGALAAIVKGGAIGTGVDAAAEFGASVIKDYYEGQKSLGRAMKDAARETAEGLPIIGGFVKNLRRFGEQLLYGGEMAGTAMAIRMREQGGTLAANRLDREERLRPYQLDSSAASARALKGFEQSIEFMSTRNSMDLQDQRILDGRMGVADAEVNLAGIQDTQGRNRAGIADRERQIREIDRREQDLFSRQGAKGSGDGKDAEVEAELVELQKRRAILNDQLIQRREQGAAMDKSAAQAVYDLEVKRLDLKKQALEVAKEELQKYKDRALSFDQMDPEQQFALSMTFDKAKSSGYAGLSSEEKRQLLGSGLAGKDLIEQSQNAATSNPLLQSILVGQGGKTLAQLQAGEQAAQGAFDAATDGKGFEAKARELRAEFDKGLAAAVNETIGPLRDSITKAMTDALLAVVTSLRAQDVIKRATGG